jgi:hypothetical protein
MPCTSLSGRIVILHTKQSCDLLKPQYHTCPCFNSWAKQDWLRT